MTEDFKEFILSVVLAEGTVLRPSEISPPGYTVLVDGRTGDDVCERSPLQCFEELYRRGPQ